MTDKTKLLLQSEITKNLQLIIEGEYFKTLHCLKEAMALTTWCQTFWWLAGGQPKSQPLLWSQTKQLLSKGYATLVA